MGIVGNFEAQQFAELSFHAAGIPDTGRSPLMMPAFEFKTQDDVQVVSDFIRFDTNETRRNPPGRGRHLGRCELRQMRKVMACARSQCSQKASLPPM